MAVRETTDYSFFAKLKRDFMTPFLGNPRLLLEAAMQTNNLNFIHELFVEEPYFDSFLMVHPPPILLATNFSSGFLHL